MLIISASLQSFPSKLPPNKHDQILAKGRNLLHLMFRCSFQLKESYEESENAEAEAQAPTKSFQNGLATFLVQQ